MIIHISAQGFDSAAAAIEQLCANLVPAMAGGMGEAVALVERAAKGNVPMDTGELMGSIHSSVNAGGDTAIGMVSAAAQHAAYVEMGTRYQPARPFMAPALRENEQAVVGCIAAAIQKGVGG